jgi:tRNA threonylcarbamoyladenosine biosynthesis protein TsaB
LSVIESLLKGIRPDVIGIAVGPGSFTGVRIGLATAKGLAEGWGIPMIGLDNLEAMADSWSRMVPDSPAAVLPAIDARKKKFYGALYHNGQTLIAPADLAPETWRNEVLGVWPGPVVLSGYQGFLLAQTMGETIPESWSVLPTKDWTPGLLDQMETSWADRRFLSPDAAPRYLRLSEAEETLRRRSI